MINGSDKDLLTDTNLVYYQGQRLKGLKPYVYYSERYQSGSLDVVITYSLDNYITVKGKKGSEGIDLAGYLMSTADNNVSEGGGTYRGTHINGNEGLIYENVYISGVDGVTDKFYQLPCRQINGNRKYSLNRGGIVLGLLNGRWQKENLLGNTDVEGQQNVVRINDVEQNSNARQYFTDSREFMGELDRLGILNLKTTDIKDDSVTNVQERFGNFSIFEGYNRTGNGNSVSIEEPTSNFNQHRLDVIKYSIEKNLSNAINNFNIYSTSDYKFQMPKLQETDWNLIYNNICIISFMQGLSIGGKIYSGYSVIPNNNNKEYVSEDSIEIVAESNGQMQVYEPTYANFANRSFSGSILRGASRNTLSRVSTENLTHGEIHYYYRFARSLDDSGRDSPSELAWSSYDSTINSVNNNSSYEINGTAYGNMYDYIDATNNNDLKVAYYTALARERKGMYRADNDEFRTEHSGDPQ